MAAAIEIALLTDEPSGACAYAVAKGATPVKPVDVKPWGQKVAYVRDLNGCLVEVCSPVSGS